MISRIHLRQTIKISFLQCTYPPVYPPITYPLISSFQTSTVWSCDNLFSLGSFAKIRSPPPAAAARILQIPSVFISATKSIHCVCSAHQITRGNKYYCRLFGCLRFPTQINKYNANWFVYVFSDNCLYVLRSSVRAYAIPIISRLKADCWIRILRPCPVCCYNNWY